MTRRMLVAGLTAAIAAAAPAAAAVTKPTVGTGGVSRVTPTSATLTGKVNPNGAQTTYFFQYGPSNLYGATTGPTDAGSGTNHFYIDSSDSSIHVNASQPAGAKDPVQ